ncbi:unnamed protein product [Gongylonema pulchrum]|uniref:DB domain-containing protein n=1 Tax=Gongylonema pulchrum TaxID=637853 RepID=A0A183CYH7_9BILA|nr:unnamed protein product [Gongylonema pulchrum]
MTAAASPDALMFLANLRFSSYCFFGVGATLAGEKCLIFCDQRPGNITQLDYTYVSCYERFESMKSCFWNDIMRRNPLRFVRRW